jgi:hypothetical protein
MTDQHVITSQHSPLGPSAAERWLNCPGSVLLTADLESPDSWYAAEGNAAHELSEWCRVQKVEASAFRGHVIKVGEFEFTVDQEMIDGVNSFVEYVDQWPGEPLYEVRVGYESYVPRGFGTLDDARLKDWLARITDLKYGTGIQVFADGPQLKLYALGLYHDYQHLYNFKDFILTINQPRLDHIDEFELSLRDLLDWTHDVVVPTAKAAMQPGAPIVAGDHCRFCPARRVCKVRANFVAEAVFRNNDFQNLDNPSELQFLTNDDVAAILPKLSTIKSWCNDLESHALSEIAKGHPVGTWKLVEGRSNRVWRGDEQAIFDGLALEVDDPDVLWEKKLFAPAKAEKLLGKKVDISDLIIKPPGSPKLAPGDDRRESLAIKAEEEFESLD